jgi:hypothetical protein
MMHRHSSAPGRLLARVGVVLALGVSTGIAALPAQAAAADDSAETIFVTTSSDVSLVDAISAQATADATYRRKAKSLTATWIKQLKDGKSQDLLDLNRLSVAQRISRLNSLKSALDAGQSTKPGLTAQPSEPAQGGADVPLDGSSPRVGAAQGVSPASEQAQAGVAPLVASAQVASVNGNQPNAFPVKGSPAGNRSYWTGMTLFVQGGPCNSSGCKTTDKYTTNLTITPAATASSVCVTSGLYIPNGGNFGNKHLHLWGINRSKIVGSRDTSDISSVKAPANCFYVANDPQLNSNVLTVAVTLWVYNNPTSAYYADGAKTNDATCKPKGDNRCFF